MALRIFHTRERGGFLGDEVTRDRFFHNLLQKWLGGCLLRICLGNTLGHCTTHVYAWSCATFHFSSTIPNLREWSPPSSFGKPLPLARDAHGRLRPLLVDALAPDNIPRWLVWESLLSPWFVIGRGFHLQ